MLNKKLAELHGFSLMLGKEHVKRFLILDDSGDQVLFEGFLGELKEISLLEAAMLEIRGSNGILRLDLSEQELRKVLKSHARLIHINPIGIKEVAGPFS